VTDGQKYVNLKYFQHNFVIIWHPNADCGYADHTVGKIGSGLELGLSIEVRVRFF